MKNKIEYVKIDKNLAKETTNASLIILLSFLWPMLLIYCSMFNGSLSFKFRSKQDEISLNDFGLMWPCLWQR